MASGAAPNAGRWQTDGWRHRHEDLQGAGKKVRTGKGESGGSRGEAEDRGGTEMTDKMQMHKILGISDKREEEISNEVLSTLTKAKRVDKGTKKLMEKYDPEAILVGMCLMKLVTLNTEAHRATVRERSRTQT